MECDVRFMTDFTMVYTLAPPLGRVGQALAPVAPPAPVQVPPALTLIALAASQQLAPQQPAALPPPTTSSGEEEVEVEDELNDEAAGPVAPKKRKGKGPARPEMQAAQPTRQSTRLQKPSTLVKRIKAGEGTARDELAGYAEDDPDPSKWANLAGYKEIITMTIQEVEGNPKSIQEAQSHSNWPRWKDAMDRKIGSLEHAGTWTTVLHPPGKNIIGCKWVFRLKQKVDRSIDKYKARLVVRGFTQIYRVDYYDTYSPVAWLTSFCLILATAAHNDWDIEAFNFNSTYLNGELDMDKEIYMQEPPRYETGGAGTVK